GDWGYGELPLDGLADLPLPAGYLRSIRNWANQRVSASTTAKGEIGNGAEPVWLPLARELQAISQTGLTYSKDKYDTERYDRLREIATEIMAIGGAIAVERIADLFRQDT